MNDIKGNYEKSIVSINNAASIYKFLESNAKNLNATIILRSQIVLIISAFDTFMHSLVIKKIIDTYFSNEQQMGIQLDIPLKLVYEMRGLDVAGQRRKLYCYLKKRLNKDSFQSPRSVEYAFSLIGICKIWTRVSNEMHMLPEDVKNTLSIIVNRRNKIAHESDWNSFSGSYEDIQLEDVIECERFINQLVCAICHIV